MDFEITLLNLTLLCLAGFAAAAVDAIAGGGGLINLSAVLAADHLRIPVIRHFPDWQSASLRTNTLFWEYDYVRTISFADSLL
jgi:uncharacterized membrane protein YfcA